MKTSITESGTLTVQPESDIEAYALSKWAEGIDWNAAVDAGVSMVVNGGGCLSAKKAPSNLPHCKEVSVAYTGADGMAWLSLASADSERHICTAHDGASIVVEQDADAVRVSLMVPQLKAEKRDRKADVGVMAKAIYDSATQEGVVSPWEFAAAAHDALYAASERRA